MDIILADGSIHKGVKLPTDDEEATYEQLVTMVRDSEVRGAPAW